MISNLNGLIFSKKASIDEVIKTIQTFISDGYKGEELLEKIDEIYGVGARNNLLKVIDYNIPTSKTSIDISYPSIFPSEKLKVGDCVIGSNSYVGEITNIRFDQSNTISSVTILGLGVSVVSEENLFAQSVLYEDLVNLKNNNQLIPGKQYRIVDYVATVYSEADIPEYVVEEHPFDIIVIADSNSKLNENARACIHDGDNYYSMNGSDLSKWELKYSLSNDNNMFSWADDKNGKGVIYYLKDDRNNECPFDFKEIKFLRHEIIGSKIAGDRWSEYDEMKRFITEPEYLDSYLNFSEDGVYFFTFSTYTYNQEINTYTILDNSTNSSNFSFCNNNSIKECHYSFFDSTFWLPDIVFLDDCCNNVLGYNSYRCTFNSFAMDNFIGGNFHNNDILSTFEENTIGSNVAFCFIGEEFSGNQMGNKSSYLYIFTDMECDYIGNGLYRLNIYRDDGENSSYDVFMNGISQPNLLLPPRDVDLTGEQPGTVIEIK